ncbi:MAG: lysophospholipase [Acetatifactor sp.]|jgi:lysophospholipase L1-like esterase|nr:lysophospholipase [Acetatifactor sp.]
MDERVERYHELNKSVQKGKILFTGSSLMEQFPIEKFMEEMGNPYTVYNRGIGGYRIADMDRELDAMALELAPSRVFINIGTNDLSDPNMPISEVMGGYEGILNRIKKACPDVEIYMMAYYPINYEAAEDFMKPCLAIRTNEKINEANQEVEKLAKKVGARYIDVNKNLKDEQGRLKAEYTVEGMHIKEEGYRSIMDDLMKYVSEPAWK